MSQSVVVPHPPERVFALLADPSAHARIDGSGTVKGSLTGPERLSLGARFGMRMHWGVPYVMQNEVVEFEEGRRIAWRHVGHHVWRWVLEPVDGGTRVTEEFDWSTSRAPLVLRAISAPQRNAESIRRTLARLPQVLDG